MSSVDLFVWSTAWKLLQLTAASDLVLDSAGWNDPFNYLVVKVKNPLN
jgi:hypothetical protein